MHSARTLTLPLAAGLLLGATGSLAGQGAPAGSFTPLPRPTLIIGREGEPDYEFVTVAMAERRPNGQVVVVDWRTPAVRIFDNRGELVRTLGREGAGPGEFRSVSSLFLAGDTVIAFDARQRRLTRYLASGALVGTQQVLTSANDGRIHVEGRFASGRWLAVTPNSPTWNRGHGLYRDTMRVGTLPASATGDTRWIGDFFGATFFAYMPSENREQWQVGWAFLAPSTTTQVLADTVIIGDTGTPELRYFLADGRPVRTVRIPLDRPPDLAALIRTEGARTLAELDPRANRPATEAEWDARRPVTWYRDFVVSPDGTLWIRLFEERPDGPVPYLVLGPSGAVRARVSLPAKSRVLSAGPSWVVSAMRDADDVERVAVTEWRVR